MQLKGLKRALPQLTIKENPKKTIEFKLTFLFHFFSGKLIVRPRGLKYSLDEL
jgi:hypothetical protein